MTDDISPPELQTPDLRLRAAPKPVLRLSRKVLIGGSLVFGMAGGGALMLAMQPQPARPKTVEARPAAERPQVSEKLAGLPADYTGPQIIGAPILGPPLPGDLGRPILSAQSASDLSVSPSGSRSVQASAYNAGNGGPQPMSQVEKARQAAIGSQLFFSAASHGSTEIGPTSASVPITLSGLEGLGVPGLQATPRQAPSAKEAFWERSPDRTMVSPERLQTAASPYLLQAGSVMPAALITGLQSDIPGQALAQITQNIFDSRTGAYLLIPQGSRLIGRYDSAIAFGQDRLLLVWDRLILPNGDSLLLDKAGAADAQGLAGLEDRTNFHWAGVVQAAAVSTVLAIGAESGSASQDSDLVRALRSGAADSVSRVGQALVERQLAVQPSISLRNGLPVRVVLARDLILQPYKD